MKRLLCFLLSSALIPVTGWAGPAAGGHGGSASVSVSHTGSGFAASNHTGSGYSSGSYAGREVSGSGYRGGGANYSGGRYGSYRGYNGYRNSYRGFGYGYPVYGYSAYGYGSYDNSYAAPPDYGYSDGADPSAYGSDTPPPAPPAAAPSPAPSAPADSAASSLPLGKIDEAGYIHSPFTNSAFKPETVANGQTFFDPVTGQAFTAQKAGTPPSTTAPKPPASTNTMPAGKIDEFGYVHSPYSTFVVKAKSDTSAQVYHDPFTGQFFTVVPRSASSRVPASQID